MFKVLHVARSAKIFSGRRALSGFSPEQRGGTSCLKFFAFNDGSFIGLILLPVCEGRHGRCFNSAWLKVRGFFVKVPLVRWLPVKRAFPALSRDFPRRPLPRLAKRCWNGFRLKRKRRALVVNPLHNGFPGAPAGVEPKSAACPKNWSELGNCL